MEKQKKTLSVTVITVLVSILFFTGLTGAPQTEAATPSPIYQLRYASHYVPEEMQNHAPRLWFEAVEKQTGGRVKVTPYYMETLGKSTEMLDNLKKGISDMATLAYVNYPGAFPITDVVSLPWLVPNQAIGTEVGYALQHKGLLDKELQGLKVLWWQATETTGLIFRRTKVTKLQDLKGMKIRTFAGAAQQTLQALGATPIAIPGAEIYTALDRGTVDGALTNQGSFIARKFHEVAKYYLWVSVSMGVHLVVMNPGKWDSFPPDIKSIMEKLNAQAKYWFFDELTRRKYGSPGPLKETGIEVYYLSPDEEQRWRKATEPIIHEWVSKMEARGLPGKEAVKTIEEIAELYKM